VVADKEAELPGQCYQYPGYPDDSANLSTFKRKTGYSGLVLASRGDSEWMYDGTPSTYARSRCGNKRPGQFDFSSRGYLEEADGKTKFCGSTVYCRRWTLSTRGNQAEQHQKPISITKEDECPSILAPAVPNSRHYTPIHHPLGGTTEAADHSHSSGVLSVPPRLAVSRLPQC
jgi:hypothetical protein